MRFELKRQSLMFSERSIDVSNSLESSMNGIFGENVPDLFNWVMSGAT